MHVAIRRDHERSRTEADRYNAEKILGSPMNDRNPLSSHPPLTTNATARLLRKLVEHVSDL